MHIKKQCLQNWRRARNRPATPLHRGQKQPHLVPKISAKIKRPPIKGSLKNFSKKQKGI